MYSTFVSFVLGGMVVTGAARSIVAKLFYQFGFENPLFLTLLYLAGQALSLIPYNLWRLCANSNQAPLQSEEEDVEAASSSSSPNGDDEDVEGPPSSSSRIPKPSSQESPIAPNNDEPLPSSSMIKAASRKLRQLHSATSNISRMSSLETRSQFSASSRLFAESVFTADFHRVDSDDEEPDDEDKGKKMNAQPMSYCDSPQGVESAPERAAVDMAREERKGNIGTAGNLKDDSAFEGANDAVKKKKKKSRIAKTRRPLHISVSMHGLPTQSRTQHIVERIPWYVKPAVPAFFNLLNSAMRWTSLVFVAASVAEMLISGMELVLAVCATRCIRGRKVTLVRWIGVGVCTIGVIMVGLFDTKMHPSDSVNNEHDCNSAKDQTIGILLILGQSIMSVLQDLCEEIFMHEADFAPALLVGMEGLYGIIIALILYFPIAPLLGEEPSEVAEDLNSAKIIGLSIGWALLVTVTGIFNISATGVTSSMTRNIWKNLRTVLIWIVGLIIFYASGNPDLGEEWTIPGSFYILLGFAVMILGIYIYYAKGSRAK